MIRISSKIHRMGKNLSSLRTTIPNAIVKVFNLQVGDDAEFSDLNQEEKSVKVTFK